eukprot:gene7841-675_t
MVKRFVCPSPAPQYIRPPTTRRATSDAQKLPRNLQLTPARDSQPQPAPTNTTRVPGPAPGRLCVVLFVSLRAFVFDGSLLATVFVKRLQPLLLSPPRAFMRHFFFIRTPTT